MHVLKTREGKGHFNFKMVPHATSVPQIMTTSLIQLSKDRKLKILIYTEVNQLWNR